MNGINKVISKDQLLGKLSNNKRTPQSENLSQ